MSNLKMWEMTWPEMVSYIDSGYGVILPIGSIEQHGYHLPMITDSFFPTQLAQDVSEDVKMLVAPPIMYATNSRPLSGGGQTFPGTTSIKGVTFIHQVEDVIREFIRSGFKKIVLLNWHMENSNFIYEAAYLNSDLAKEMGVKIMVNEAPFDKLDDELMDYVFEGQFGGWALDHAGVLETALMMHLKPEYVREDKIIDDKPPVVVDYDIIPIDTERFVSKSGCLWKATLATAEKGRRLWDFITSSLTETINSEFSGGEKNE